MLIPLSLSGINRSMFTDMGNPSCGRASITLDDVRVPATFRIGEEGQGFVKVMRTFDASWVLVALSALAMAEASLAEAVEYVKKGMAFGYSLSKFPGAFL